MAQAKLIDKSADSDTVALQLTARKRTTLCRCPKCGVDHKMRINWIGRGLPRKYCPLCKNNLKSVAGNLHILDIRMR